MIKKFISFLVCCLLLVSVPGICLAEATYTIAEPELARLEQIFNQLQINNSQLLDELQASKTDLTAACQKLEEYQRELATLQVQLKQLKEESTTAKNDLEAAQNLLVKANQSLQKYEREVKAEGNKLKMERDIGYLLAVVLAFRK